MGFEAISGPNLIVSTPPAGDSSNRAADTAFVASSVVNGVIASTGLSETTTATTVSLAVNLIATTASLGADVNINNTTSYFDGPSVAQGSTGTWSVSGQVTLVSASLARTFSVRLWDGATIINSCAIATPNAPGFYVVASLAGYLGTPAGNIRISVQQTNADGLIKFNQSGNSKDSTITAIRIA